MVPYAPSRSSAKLLEAQCLPDDLHALGFTAEETERAKRLAPPPEMEPVWIFPLIERGLTKADCLAIIERAGIELPLIYRLGYNNANCIGCCKGGMGYWNKIRQDFPERFAEVAAIEAEIGPSAYLFRDRKTGERFSLTQLDPNAGTHNEVVPDCSFFCAMAEEEIA